MIVVVGSEQRGGFLRASSSSASRASSSSFLALKTGRSPRGGPVGGSYSKKKKKKRKKSGRRTPNNNCFHGGGDKNEEAGEKIKNVAIIGAGFAGLSCAYNLIKCSSNSSDSNGAGVRVTVFASERAGRGGASSVAAGLLHRRTPKGSKMPFGSLGYAKTVEMLEKCQKIEEMMVDPDLNLSSGIDFRFSGELRDVKRGKMFRKVGCLRPARTEKDTIGIKKNVLLKNTKNDNNNNNNNDDKRLMLEEEEIEDAIRFVERDEIEVDLLRLRNKGEEVGDKDKDVNNSCGFYVENGIVVDAQRYLEALKVLIEFEAAKNADANVSFAFKKRRVESLEDVAKESFDAVILCCGGEILRDGFLDDSTKQELLEKVGGPLELQAGRALVLERENCFVREEGGEKWEMPGILGSHYLSPFQTTKAMFGPTKERGDKVKAEDAAKAGYYSTEAAKASFPDTPETIDFLLRELNEKVYPRANSETKEENQTNIFFSTKDIDTVAYGVRVNGPRTHAGRFPKIIQFDEKEKANDSRKIFAVTAVGARGLLYHALLGEWVARTVLLAASSSSSAASSSSSPSSKDDDHATTTFETIVPAEFR
jgi:glycine/D-amino acid oxidase-like deaminating enzyme